MVKRKLMGGVLAACGLWMGAPGVAVPAAPATSPWVLSADGTLVIDTRSHLAWDRCVAGMLWNGSTCTGRARLLTFAQARALADERWKASGVRWRLPRVPELRRLVNRGASPPAVDAAMFPGAPADWHWTSTRSVNTAAVNPASTPRRSTRMPMATRWAAARAVMSSTRGRPGRWTWAREKGGGT